MEDLAIQPLGMNIISPDEGEDGHLQLAIIKGIALPFADPATGEPVMVPTGQVRVPLNKEFALRLAAKLREEAEKLPDEKPKSDLQIATSIQDADRIAKMTGGLRS